MTSASELTTSAPGEAADLLRSLFYEVMGLPEPTEPALLDLLPLPDYRPPTRTVPLRVRTRPGPRPHEVTVERVTEGRYGPSGPGSDHLAVHEDTLDQGLLGLADAILRYGEADDPGSVRPGSGRGDARPLPELLARGLRLRSGHLRSAAA